MEQFLHVIDAAIELFTRPTWLAIFGVLVVYRIGTKIGELAAAVAAHECVCDQRSLAAAKNGARPLGIGSQRTQGQDRYSQ